VRQEIICIDAVDAIEVAGVPNLVDAFTRSMFFILNHPDGRLPGAGRRAYADGN